MEFLISTDKDKLDIPKIHEEVASTYWGKGRSMEQTLMTIEKSVCFGMYAENGEQIAYTRIMTDGLVFAYIMDVVVFDPYKGKGLGKKLIKHILDRPDVSKVNTVALKTKDAHSFYETLGFKRIGDSEMWMSIDRVKYD
ncbi:GCN5-related N-acetyltransferase [Allomuricauda ruestringensis DSM 13258]|uniref:GCN5-related N-acetyltransferase n=1 Tax=Allomuricauda ruestringensis (strain DSM 13258 / CIP 107369 / LMG 19739 / B1) TaxID=886377 RepID=G2PL81_ALLRU|nr:GNAT family N-acetyltransferase [Allomuricauda ruestringensis]AEM72138.1 GCN5-related N-acetyltransferase [Allomuricauda ruestringensis DSM 13258]